MAGIFPFLLLLLLLLLLRLLLLLLLLLLLPCPLTFAFPFPLLYPFPRSAIRGFFVIAAPLRTTAPYPNDGTRPLRKPAGNAPQNTPTSRLCVSPAATHHAPPSCKKTAPVSRGGLLNSYGVRIRRWQPPAAKPAGRCGRPTPCRACRARTCCPRRPRTR